MQPETWFDCNICFDQAREPVVTRCGHLYCWSCISEWLKTGVHECPVCKASTGLSSLIRIYGRGIRSPSNHGKDFRTEALDCSDSYRPDNVPAVHGASLNSGVQTRPGESQLRRVALTHFFLVVGTMLILLILNS